MDQEAVVVAEVHRVAGALLVLVACVEEEKPADTAEPFVAPLAAPWLAVTGSTNAGAFKSTCTMSADLTDAADGAAIATVPLSPADGGRWAGVALPDGVQLKATLTWDDCENTPAGTGSFPSSTFSGVDGALFVLHYDGVDAGFETMTQAADHLGGEVHVQFVVGTAEGDIEALAASLGGTVRADDEDATFRYLSWTDDQSVADVLSALGADATYAWGEPTWVAKPAWW